MTRLLEILITLLVDTFCFGQKGHFLNKSEKTPLCKIGILAKLLPCETSSSTVNKMRGDQDLGNIDQFIGGHILFRTKRAYLLNKGEKTP